MNRWVQVADRFSHAGNRDSHAALRCIPAKKDDKLIMVANTADVKRVLVSLKLARESSLFEEVFDELGE